MKRPADEADREGGEARSILRFPGPSEARIFRIGLILLLVEALCLTFLFFANPLFAERIVAVLVAIAIGGGSLSMPTGLAVGMHPAQVIAVHILYNCMYVPLFYSLMVAAYSNLVDSRFLRRLVGPATRIAEDRSHRMRRWPSLFLVLIVWIPLPWTGAAVGSMVGYLLGMPSRRVMAVVLPAMVGSVVTWTLGFEYLFLFRGMTGRIVILSFVLAVMLSAVYMRFSTSKRPG